MRTLMKNDRFESWEWKGDGFAPAAYLPLSDRAFRYGMSLFETLRIRGGDAEFFDAHATRLLGACGERAFAIDERALAASALLLRGKVGVARIYATAGDGAPAAPAEAVRVFVLFEPRLPASTDACDLTFCDEPYRPLFGGLKTGNYWFNAEARAEAQRRGFDEAFLFNDLGELVSACMANVFLVHDGRLSTPARKTGARAGVIREWLIARRKVEERRLRREDAISADEIFLTSSWIGVLPVSTLEGRPLGPRSIGPKLAAELDQRCG